MNKIAITGGGGFIGGWLAKKLVENKQNFVVIIDDFSTGKVENLPSTERSNWELIRHDVTDYSIRQVVKKHEFKYIFHYAATVGVQRTLQDPLKVLQDIDGLKNIFSIALNHKCERFFFSSSSEVYGESTEFPQNEKTTPINSRLPYAIVKNLGEAYLKALNEKFKLDYTCFRFFNTYGEGQSQDFVISRFLNKAIKNQDIEIYGDGNQTRTFCHIYDNIEATVNAFQKNMFINEVVNIGNNNETSILDLAKLIIQITGSKSKIVHLPELEAGDMKRRCPDITNMKKLLNRDFTSLKDGLKKMIQ